MSECDECCKNLYPGWNESCKYFWFEFIDAILIHDLSLVSPSSSWFIQKCGETQLKAADDVYKKSKNKYPDAENLMQLAMNDIENVYKICEKTRVCVDEEKKKIPEPK